MNWVQPRPWTPDEDAALKALIGTLGYAEIAARLGRTRRACEARGHAIGARRAISRPWTAADDARLREIYPRMKAADVAAEIDRSVAATIQRAKKLGLRKSRQWRVAGRDAPCSGSVPTGRRREGSPRAGMAAFHQQRGGLFDGHGLWTPTADAARHLQRIAPIWRCGADGTADPKGAHWKFSGRVMTAADVEARAERAGWVRP